jgi:L-seryl-tRNA(Ser) seleniumtransferase
VQPFINLTATYTINGGTLTLPEVKRAMEEASHYPVNIDELMEKVGERLARLMQCEWGIVTSGCAAALAHATAACVAGTDPERMQQLPDLTGLKDQVVMPKQSRNQYDHAIRGVGVKIVEVDSREEFYAALGDRTAMIAVLGTGEASGKVRLEEIAEAGRKRGIPVLVDAAAELPIVPNPYLSRGADMVGYSGGKIIRGPQCAGLLLGRKDLVRAAWLNSSPHHAFGRPMKVGKEEIMGMLAAIEVWTGKRDIQAEYREWQSWYGAIAEDLAGVGGIRTQVRPPAGASPFPVLEIAWDPARIGITAGELGRRLLNGQPRIMSHAEGEGHSFVIRPAAMKTGEYKLVARRLRELFSAASQAGKQARSEPPVVDISGRWEVELQFLRGSARHSLVLETSGTRVSGTHSGTSRTGVLNGSIHGNHIRLRSSLPYEGTRLSYTFTGVVEEGAISGEVDMDEYGRARFSARRSRPA